MSNPIDELEFFKTPIGKLKDPEEAIKFISWLPDLKHPGEAYFSMLLARAKEKKKLFGYRGKERALAKLIIPGYLRNPKLRLYLGIRRLALLGEYAYELFVYERHYSGTNIVSEVWRYPSEFLAVFVDVNPHDWVHASFKAINEFMNSIYRILQSGDIREYKRLDEMVKSYLPTTSVKGGKKYFTIDIDDWRLVDEIITGVMEYTGFVPARILTPRGIHLLVSWQDIPKEKREEFRKYIKAVEEVYSGLVEYKPIPQEPMPGTEYRGHIVRFFKEEK